MTKQKVTWICPGCGEPQDGEACDGCGLDRDARCERCGATASNTDAGPDGGEVLCFDCAADCEDEAMDDGDE